MADKTVQIKQFNGTNYDNLQIITDSKNCSYNDIYGLNINNMTQMSNRLLWYISQCYLQDHPIEYEMASCRIFTQNYAEKYGDPFTPQYRIKIRGTVEVQYSAVLEGIIFSDMYASIEAPSGMTNYVSSYREEVYKNNTLISSRIVENADPWDMNYFTSGNMHTINAPNDILFTTNDILKIKHIVLSVKDDGTAMGWKDDGEQEVRIS